MALFVFDQPLVTLMPFAGGLLIPTQVCWANTPNGTPSVVVANEVWAKKP